MKKIFSKLRRIRIRKSKKKIVRKQFRSMQLQQYNTNFTRECAAKYAGFYNNQAVKKHIILYEAFFGRGMLCNSNGLFQEFIKRDDFKKWEHIWVIEDFEINQKIINDYKNNKNVRFVQYLGKEYLYYLACAKILINNVTFPSFFTKKEEQIYINTWHGIPLKTLGYDQENGNYEVANTIRNLLCTDYLISSCDYLTQAYKKAFKLDGIFRGKIIVEGQPRNDLLLNGNRLQIIDKMVYCGVNIDPNKKVVLFAPTWKGKTYNNPTIDIQEYFLFIQTLEAGLPMDEFQVLVKPHQLVYQHIKNDNRLKEDEHFAQFIPAILDANEVLSVTDILVSDYSSIYFDFMVTDRPILFYIPDFEDYKKDRGLYLPIEDLPGPATKDLMKIPEWIMSIHQVKDEYRIKYREQKEKFVFKDDGKVSERVWDVIFNGDGHYNVINKLKTKKKKIMVYLGILKRVNGIIESFYSLMNLLDYNKFDVSVVIIPSTESDIMKKLSEMNPNVRVLSKVGQRNATIDEATDNKMVVEYSLDDPDIKKYYSESFYYKEYRRNFGDAKFDFIVNYTGYGKFYSILLLQAKEAKKFIWLHNDLLQDKKKVINGVKVNEKALSTVFSVYPYYDKLVSCSESVMYVNRKSISTKDTYDKFTYCRNLLNFSRVFDKLEEESEAVYKGKKYYVKIQEELGIPAMNSDFLSIKMIPIPKQKNINFITMGRMSPEKNHENMIRAFARFNREYQNSMLYVLGDGLLMYDMQKLIRDEFCNHSVCLLGNVPNPFAFMKHCDCFVLPSMHEGQPLVLLEARAMGLPIIVAEFSTITDSLIEGGQLLIKQDVQSIYEGFVAFAEGKVPCREFDYNQYNLKSYLEFERLFESE